MVPLNQPLDLASPEAAQFLETVQGNIVKSHGRDNAEHIFVRFGKDPAEARNWLSQFAAAKVTSALQQEEQRRAWRAGGGPGELFCTVLLSFDGYTALGVPAASVPVEPGRTYFEKGMKNQAAAERPFNDPPAGVWESPYQGSIHALIVLAHDDSEELSRCSAEIRYSLSGFCDAVWFERGTRLEFDFDGRMATIEHFGYEDGISNPVLTLQAAEEERAARGFDKWDGAGELSLVFAAEPGHADRYGSFFVFRKLEQNVRAFKAATAELAGILGDAADDRAGAMAVGRFRDGTPILPVTAPTPGAPLNNFNFRDADPSGAVCPFHAHIRKTNPRGDTPLPPPVERGFRIVRRGITYGSRPDLGSPDLQAPSAGVGLLFMSYQARLDQFAIQQEGSDSNDFLNPGVGADAVIGQNGAPVPQEWPAGSGIRFTMANFVKMLGGEYFFAPSMAFLRELGAG